MEIIIKPCEGITEHEAVDYAQGAFEPKKVDYRAIKKGYTNGQVLIYNDNTAAYFYRTEKADVLRFDRKGSMDAKKA